MPWGTKLWKAMRVTRHISQALHKSIHAERFSITARNRFFSKTNTLRNCRNMSYILPAESVSHSHTLMAFPSILSVDSESDLSALQREVTLIANTISHYEPVHLFARSDLINKAASLAGPNVHVKAGPANQLWIRDSGPVYVRNEAEQKLVAVGFNFNYWGKKFPKSGDEMLAKYIAEQAGESYVSSKLVLEGGALEHDGEGTFLGTESCLINGNRNPNLTKADIEAELTTMLGVTHFVWIPGIRNFDITDYHIDAVARFVEPGVVLLSKPAPSSPTIVLEAYKTSRRILENSRDAKGRTLTIYDCEEPDVTTLGPPDSHNECVASYVNYLLVNGAVIMAKFEQATEDKAAFELLQKLFPARKVVQVSINMLARTGGGIHCATQQVPAW